MRPAPSGRPSAPLTPGGSPTDATAHPHGIQLPPFPPLRERASGGNAPYTELPERALVSLFVSYQSGPKTLRIQVGLSVRIQSL